MRPGVVISLALLAASLCLAQWTRENEDLRIHVSANLVQVDAVVTGPHGEHVNSLATDDFQLLLDGQPQKSAISPM